MLPLKLKGVFIVSLLFAAILLPAFSCPWSPNNKQSSSNPTPTPTIQSISDWISGLSPVRQSTYDAIKLIEGLHRGLLPLRYYFNATSYYYKTIAPSFNNWLNKLYQEAQQGQTTIGTTNEDIQQENTAFALNDGFIQWANTLAKIYSRQGQGVTPGTHQGGYLIAMKPMGEDPPVVEDFVKGAWGYLQELGKNTAEDVTKYTIQKAYQQATIEFQLTQAMWGTWQDALNSAG